ncbi:tripartite tricarboxylate transporter TctB family protein [Pseudooceanicola onchidii]|uniref:tripartite tricarboxylate transporter TctB family protein n=1 Tax=Pseudooceanicola onchidii TaxID=2562279 RepID=UPI0010AB2BE0|nr:tripartite tricarboxylate transporter TctB family protein [Pseudooceanicola onchidii]
MNIETDHHDGTSDATPGGYEKQRRPGELVFCAFLALASLFLVWDAWGIENAFGPNGLSSPRAIPLATTLVMAVSAIVIFVKDMRLPKVAGETVRKDILPVTVVILALMLVAYGVALNSLGFLPTSALFLIVAIKLLARRGWAWTLAVSLGSLILIWVIFRIVFTVLMPSGIVPEAEFIQLFRNLLSGAN